MEKLLKNKNILITGATDGIGLFTAEKLAREGANLYLVGRNPGKTETVVEKLRNAHPDLTVDFFIADLSLPSQVKNLAQTVLTRLDRLDVLLNNAGAFFKERILTAEGHESTFALNHLNYFLLTHHLLPLLRSTGQARIVNTASQAHVGADLDFSNLQGEKSYNGWKAYQMSKLENILFTYELAERLTGTGLTANALHPGFVATKFGDNNKGMVGGALKVAKSLFAINQDKGSQTSFHLCTSPSLENVTGKYFDKSKEKTSSPQSRNVDTRKKLWEITEELLKSYL